MEDATMALRRLANFSLSDDPITSDLLDPESIAVISDEFAYWFRLIIKVSFGQILNVFAVCSNVVNMAVFLKQGLKDSVTIGFFALAVSDFASCLALVWINILTFPGFADIQGLPFNAHKMSIPFGNWVHARASEVTNAITIYITLERCLCVTLPLKVKSLFTTKRTIVMMVGIYVAIIVSIALPHAFLCVLEWKFSPERNRSIFDLTWTRHREAIVAVIFVYLNFFPILSSITIIACTSLLVFKLYTRGKWRQRNASATNPDHSETTSSSISDKDKRVGVMVALIAIIYVVCYTPRIAHYLLLTSDPHIRVDGRKKNLHTVVTYTSRFFAAINSCANLFIYLKLSSAYRETIRSLCSREKK